jgi:hypothetical protein
MPRATTKAASLADGPALASTRDYWITSGARQERADGQQLSAGPRSARRQVGPGPRSRSAVILDTVTAYGNSHGYYRRWLAQ